MNKNLRYIARVVIIAGATFTTAAASNAFAGGLVGDFLRATGQGELGDALDDGSREFKKVVPAYEELENNITNQVRTATGQDPLCMSGQETLYDSHGNFKGCF
ncbi:hypothetical protein [Rhizobium leguminosarum]